MGAAWALLACDAILLGILILAWFNIMSFNDFDGDNVVRILLSLCLHIVYASLILLLFTFAIVLIRVALETSVEITDGDIRVRRWEFNIDRLGHDWGCGTRRPSGEVVTIPWCDFRAIHRDTADRGTIFEPNPDAPLPTALKNSKKQGNVNKCRIMLVTRKEAPPDELHAALKRHAGEKYKSAY
jgi:hypothetical protein